MSNFKLILLLFLIPNKYYCQKYVLSFDKGISVITTSYALPNIYSIETEDWVKKNNSNTSNNQYSVSQINKQGPFSLNWDYGIFKHKPRRFYPIVVGVGATYQLNIVNVLYKNESQYSYFTSSLDFQSYGSYKLMSLGLNSTIHICPENYSFIDAYLKIGCGFNKGFYHQTIIDPSGKNPETMIKVKPLYFTISFGGRNYIGNHFSISYEVGYTNYSIALIGLGYRFGKNKEKINLKVDTTEIK